MTDGHYPDGDPYGRGVADEVYGTGGHAAYPAAAYDAYDSGAHTAYTATAVGPYDSYDSGAWQTGGHDGAGYDSTGYQADAYGTAQQGYDTTAYGTSSYESYDPTTGGYGSGTYATPAYDSSGGYPAVDASGGYPAYDSGAYQAATGYGTDYGQSVPQQVGYDTAYDGAAWSADVMTVVQDAPDADEQSADWSAEPWQQSAANAATATWSSAPDAWSDTDNRLGADAFQDAYRNDAANNGWYDASAIVAQEPTAPAYDGYAWQDAEQWHNGNPAGADAPTALFSADADVLTVDPFAGTQEFVAQDFAAEGFAAQDFAAEAFTTPGGHEATYDSDGYDAEAYEEPYHEVADEDADEDEGPQAAPDGTPVDGSPEIAAVAGVTGAAAGSRAARRKTTKRTRPMAKVAGASLGVLGATAMAVAAAGGIQAADAQGGAGDDTVAMGADVPLASPLDQQFADLRGGAEDFAERASRAQTRIALQERQEEQARQQDEERKKREALRPKYSLPVAPGLSAYFGQSGGRWSNLHTGIDFPVGLGTPVRAVTDGVVRTEWNRAYGNMVILTSPDGTETWYCHLTRAKVVSGPVKAGDVIAYSGNSGNSTGPHLHLEVRPKGGAPINPIPWLRARGLDPT